MSVKIGAKVTEESTDQLFALGTRFVDDADGHKEWMYLEADEAITGAGSVVHVKGDFGCEMADITSTADETNAPVAVAGLAVTSGSYFWGQIYGSAEVTVLASAAAGGILHSTATPGALDDASAGEKIDNMYATEADGGSGGLITCILSYPVIGLTI